MEIYRPDSGITCTGSAAIQATGTVQFWITADGVEVPYIGTGEGGPVATGAAEIV